MKLLTKAITKKLLENSTAPYNKKPTLVPVVKIFGGSACTWLFTELDVDGDTLFGLCDLGHGSPEFGTVSLKELESTRFQFGLPAERDRWFNPDKTLSEYGSEARKNGRIIA